MTTEFPTSTLVEAEADLKLAISKTLTFVSDLITQVNQLKQEKADLIRELTKAQAGTVMQPQRPTEVRGVPATEHWMHQTMKPGSGIYE